MKRLVCILLLTLPLTGCQGLLHELQPHRLWRMNYTDSPGRTDGAYFSISDPLHQPPAGHRPAPGGVASVGE